MSALRRGQSNFGLSISEHLAPAFTCFSLGSLFVRPATSGWFVGKDVAEALGYSNTRKALADHVDGEDKTDGVTIRDSIGREQKPVIINESGLYSLIFQGRVAQAGGVSSIQKIASLSPLSPLISVALVAKVALVA